MNFLYVFAMVILLASCSNNLSPNDEKNSFEPFYAPKSGTIIAADSFLINDPLNVLHYSAKIISKDLSDFGKYDLTVSYGHNSAKTEIAFPELTRQVIPALRRDNEATYIIGFYYKGDSTFNDYAQISTRRQIASTEIELRYIKSYYIDSLEVE